ncbi:MAG: TlyA family RNA methyltransferase [Chloroflexota bacterium]|nr:TlyA family RNA methyltransferase [Chloroflexota bacterium]
MKKQRIDILLVERGLSETRKNAQRLVMAGEVRVDGEMIHKSSTQVAENAKIEVKQRPKYVSRGGKKLAAAVEAFDVNVTGKVCADVGASTGGFTDCLLQNGALKVYAIDVGYGVLHWKLRNDPRVVVMERINARYLDFLPEPVSLVTIDASFISLALLLPAVKGWFDQEVGQTIALIKPQFEAARKAAARHAGVIKDQAVHEQVIKETLHSAVSLGFFPVGLIPSPIKGPKGNVEFLVDLRLKPNDKAPDYNEMIRRALETLP